MCAGQKHDIKNSSRESERNQRQKRENDCRFLPLVRSGYSKEESNPYWQSNTALP